MRLDAIKDKIIKSSMLVRRVKRGILRRSQVLTFLSPLLKNRILDLNALTPSNFEDLSLKQNVHHLFSARVLTARAKIVTSLARENSEIKIFGWGKGGKPTEEQRVFLPAWLSTRAPISQPVAISNIISHPDNLYHFYLDNALPIFFIHNAGVEGCPNLLLLLEKPTTYQRKLLNFLEMGWVYRPNQAACAKLSVVKMTEKLRSDSVSHFRQTPAWHEHYREVTSGTKFPSSRVYLARRSRQPLNQASVVEVALKYGYETVFFEDLTFREQIRLGAGVSHWIADHGAGLVHMIWGKPKSLIEIVPLTPYGEIFGDDCFRRLLSEIEPGATYLPVLGNGELPQPPINRLRRRNGGETENGFIANLAALSDALEYLHPSKKA